jgi:subtilase family serine protease
MWGHRSGRIVLSSFAVFFAWAIGGPGPALADEPIEHEQFGNVSAYHQAVCSRSIAPGQARCHAHVTTDYRGVRILGRLPNATSAIAPSGYGPADLRAAYRITATGSPGTIVAVVDAYGYPNAEADLAAYRKQYGLPACTSASGCFIKLSQSGTTAYPAYNTGWAQEQALDLDMVSAMCPNCRIMLVEASSSSLAALATSVTTAIARGAKVVSNSYGGSESGTSAYALAYSHPGVAITASAGDSGYGASFPATAPGTIAVGGTVLQKSATARGWNETAWNDTGSGCSALFAKPTWQTDKLCARRMANDIAAVASPSTGVAVYGPTGSGTASGWMIFGGTSVGAPLIGGIYGAVAASPNGAQKIWQSAGGAALNDITSGSNGTCSGTYFCTAGVGYDGPSGNGSPAGIGAF